MGSDARGDGFLARRKWDMSVWETFAMISQVQWIGAGVLCLLPAIAWGQGVQLKMAGEVIHGPAANEDNAAWLRAMHAVAAEALAEIRYDGSEYGRPELAWANAASSSPR